MVPILEMWKYTCFNHLLDNEYKSSPKAVTVQLRYRYNAHLLGIITIFRTLIKKKVDPKNLGIPSLCVFSPFLLATLSKIQCLTEPRTLRLVFNLGRFLRWWGKKNDEILTLLLLTVVFTPESLEESGTFFRFPGRTVKFESNLEFARQTVQTLSVFPILTVLAQFVQEIPNSTRCQTTHLGKRKECAGFLLSPRGFCSEGAEAE